MSTPIATVLSYLFHPLLMATYLVGSLLHFAPSAVNAEVLSSQSLGILLLALLAYTFIIPVLLVYGMQQMRLIDDITLQTLEERRFPLWITVAVYALATYFFGWKFGQLTMLSDVLGVVLGSITAAIFCLALISMFWQISAHMTGIGGVIGFLLAVLYQTGDIRLSTPILLSILAAGWIAASRLQLNAHNTEEVAAGLLLGIGICGSGCLIFL